MTTHRLLTEVKAAADRPRGDSRDRQRRWRARRRAGIERVELWLPDVGLWEQLAAAGYLASPAASDDPAARARAISRLLARWSTVTRHAGDPLTGAMAKIRRDGTAPIAIESEDKLRRRAAQLCLARDRSGLDVGQLAERYNRFRRSVWPGVRDRVRCPDNFRGTVEEHFFEALRNWDAAITALQMEALLKKGTT